MNNQVVIGGDLILFNIIDGECTLNNVLSGECGIFTPLYPPSYTGSVVVTPSAEAQTLETAGLMVSENIVINPIPQNYGLITWNGSKLTVS